MKAKREDKRPQSTPPRGRGRTTTSPPRSRRSKASPPSALLSEQSSTADLITDFEDLKITPNSNYDNNPRSFPYSVKQQCWDKAEKVKGRDPDRWRRDPLGNIVFRKLVGCPGCLCHDYDHILPYSKCFEHYDKRIVMLGFNWKVLVIESGLWTGGKSTLENCQVLQATVNRSKGNRTNISRADLIQRSSYCRVSGRDMDLFELSSYGNVRRGEDSSGGGCKIQ